MKKFIQYTCASLALLNGSVTLQAMEAVGTADAPKTQNWAENLFEAHTARQAKEARDWAENLFEAHTARQAKEAREKEQRQREKLAEAHEEREARAATKRLTQAQKHLKNLETEFTTLNTPELQSFATEVKKQVANNKMLLDKLNKDPGNRTLQQRNRVARLKLADLLSAKLSQYLVDLKELQMEINYKKREIWLKPTIAAGTALLITGALYAGLKWYQRRRIVRTLARHTIKLITLTPTQKDALAAAFKAGYRVPGSLRNLARLAQKADFASSAVPAETMWRVAAELYYRAVPTEEQIEALKAMMRA
jgi:hypothetical protein